ncbi:MAG TPA: CoA transferase [Longimicrobium sp.]|nr:CoA transferase [Longimicrobium sp.]
MEPLPPDPLDGIHAVTLAVNLPGPLACARLHALGAVVTKVEPPAGDPLAGFTPGWYAELAAGQRVVTLDLKDEAGRAALEPLLAGADLLVTASRPSAVERLGLGWMDLHARHPRLCHVAITGYPPPDEDRPGHDLTYLASAGLLAPPALPRTLMADLAAAERAVSTALALLLARARDGDGDGRHATVAIADLADELAAPLRHGLTAPGDVLGGGSPTYGIYRAKDGWIALAALEPQFARRLAAELYVNLDRPALEDAFARRAVAEWTAWAEARDLPVAAVEGAPEQVS